MQINSKIIKSFGTCPLMPNSYTRGWRFHVLHGDNFYCVTSNNAFNCTNKFLDPYLRSIIQLLWCWDLY